MRILLFSVFLLEIAFVSGIIIQDRDSSSSSSEEYGGGRVGGNHHGHHHHGGHGGGGRPRPPRPSRRCEDGWMMFNRTQGTWCVKVFYAQGSWDSAQAVCQANGATVTGYQDANERMAVANAARVLNMQHGNPQFSEVWVGAKRNPQCTTASACAPNDAFSWSDGHTTGKLGFAWGAGEPNTWIPANECVNGVCNQGCIVIHITNTDAVRARYGFSHGEMDDSKCWYTEWTMFACGKKP